MNFLECISITAAITTIIHFTTDSFLCCFNYEEEENKKNIFDKLE